MAGCAFLLVSDNYGLKTDGAACGRFGPVRILWSLSGPRCSSCLMATCPSPQASIHPVSKPTGTATQTSPIWPEASAQASTPAGGAIVRVDAMVMIQ